MPDNVPVVRPAVAGDQERVQHLVLRLGHSVAVEPDAFKKSFAQVLADSPRTMLHVAESGGAVAGYALTTVNTLLYTNAPHHKTRCDL